MIGIRWMDVVLLAVFCLAYSYPHHSDPWWANGIALFVVATQAALLGRYKKDA